MSLFGILALLSGDPCAPVVEPPIVGVEARSAEISIARSYGIPWAVCAQEKGAKAPVLRVTAKDGAGTHVLLDKPIELGTTLRDASRTFSERASGCDGTVPNRRDANAVLLGAAGDRHWYNRRAIEVELIAEGPLAPLAFKVQTEVFCRACDETTASVSYYQNDFDKNTVRMVFTLAKARFECAKGGGQLKLRRFWTTPETDTWVPLQPYDVIDNLQERLKPDGENVSYELIEPAARFCKAGKKNVFEVIGVDEYATIFSGNYGPSRAIRREGIEFLRCK